MLIRKRNDSISEFDVSLASKIEAPKRSTLSKIQNRNKENDIWNGYKTFYLLYLPWVTL